MKKNSIVTDNHNETTIKTDQNECLDKSSDYKKQYNPSPFSPKFLFPNQQSIPIPSLAYSYNHISYAQKVKESLEISANRKKSVEVTVLSDTIQNPKVFAFKPETKVNYLVELKTQSILKHLRLSRYSILVNAFTDILTIGIPPFLCCVIIGLRGLKKMSIWYLFAYLCYLAISMAPYLLVSLILKRIEVWVMVGFILCLKAFNFFEISLLCFRLCSVKNDIKNKVAIDYHAYPGPNCFCCELK